MAVRLVIGRSGSGKTRRCYSRIVEAMRQQPLGPPIYLLLPRQATFQAERELACGWGLEAFVRARIVSFPHLAKEILDDCGGVAIPQITPIGRRMIIGHLLRRHEGRLKFFGASARQPGLANRLEMTFGEFEHAGKTPEDVERTIDELRSTDPGDLDRQLLLGKLGDLHLLYEAYAAYLGQERLDPARRLKQVLESISSCSILRDADVYVDGFYDFSEYERQIVIGIARVCRDIEINLTVDPASPTVANPNHLPDELGLFYRTEQTFRDLHFGFKKNNVAIDEIIRLTESPRFAAEELGQLEKQLFSSVAGLGEAGKPGSPTPATGAILLAEAADRRREAGLAARHAQTLLRKGLRLRDIAVLCRDLGQYYDELSASFGEHDLPYFVDRPQAMAHHPLLQFVKSALALPLAGWPHEAVMTLLKSGLVGISDDELDALENYVVEHRIVGSAWTAEESWKFIGRAGDEDDNEALTPDEQADRELARRAQSVREDMLNRFGPFLAMMAPGQSASMRSYAHALYEMLRRFEVPSRLSKWMQQAQEEGLIQQRAEHEQVWVELMDLLDQVVDLLGDETMEAGAFAEVVQTGLEDMQLALPPQGIDQVLIGQIDRTRLPAVKAVILMGMAEGIFPKLAAEDSILSDGERRILRDEKLLRSHPIRTHAETDRALLDENFLAYLAMTQPSQRLILTRPVATDANKSLEPSIYWRRVRQLFPDAPLSPPEEQSATAISTPRQLVTRLMRWVRAGAPDCSRGLPTAGRTQESPATEDVWPGLYHWLSTHDCCNDRVDVVRFRSWKALGHRNEAKLSAAVAHELFPSPLRCSVTQIESFARCPFQHYCRYGLGLEPPPDPDPTVLDLGNVYHQTLEKLVTAVLQQRLDWRQLPPLEARRLIHECTQAVGETLRERIMLSNARNRHILQQIESTVEHVARCHQERGRQSAFEPSYVELGFGFPDARLPALSINTPKGRELLLRGKIDRVDLLAKETAFAVIDYKLGGRRLKLHEVYYGLSLQLLTYLLVLSANGKSLTSKTLTPAAALYVQLLRELESVEHPDEATPDPDLYLKPNPRGIVDAQYLSAFDQSADEGKTSLFTRTDLAAPNELTALLDFVGRQIAALADQVLDGNVDIKPYRIGTATPCSMCDFRPVCRFETAMNSYRFLTPMKKEAVMERIQGGTR